MKLHTTLAALLLIAPLAGTTMAQQGRDYQTAGVRHSDASSYGYASVLRATPIYENYRTTQQDSNCYDDGYSRVPDNRSRTTAGTVIGAVIGGALGNQVGKGDGRKAATVVGAVAGGAIGHHVASNNSRDYGPPCRAADVEDRRIAGYDVEYNYKGEIYVTRMSYNPGNRLRVRVTVVPDDRSGPPVGY